MPLSVTSAARSRNGQRQPAASISQPAGGVFATQRANVHPRKRQWKREEKKGEASARLLLIP